MNGNKFLLNLFLVYSIYLFIEAKVIVEKFDSNSSTIFAKLSDFEAYFGPGLKDDLKGLLVYANPHNACTTIEGPPHLNSTGLPFFALIARGGCDFDLKVYNAQNSDFKAAIVHNVGSNELRHMPPNLYGDDVLIPSVFVGENAGSILAEEFNYKRGYTVTLTPDFILSLNIYLYPFIAIVGLCFILMIIFMLAKCIRDRKKSRRNRLSKEKLNKVPTKKFKKGDEYDVCAICLDEYEDGDKLRILPCSHAYHSKCVDPWLTVNKKTCPVCKRKVLQGSDDDSSDDESYEEAPSETTPLIGGSLASSQSSLGYAGLRVGGSSQTGSRPQSGASAEAAAYEVSSSEDDDNEVYLSRRRSVESSDTDESEGDQLIRDINTRLAASV